MSKEPIISACKISKQFPGTLALDQVDFDVKPGEIHALCGENGAGKSTLMLILAGVYQPNGGEVNIDGQSVVLSNPQQAHQLGVSSVFQELALTPNMSVAENVFTNNQPVNRLGIIRVDDMYRQTRRVLAGFGIDIDPQAPLVDYSVAIQQIVEIARAIQRKARVLILDEPTSSIGEGETRQLFKILRQLRESGMGIVYVSHKLAEIFSISDRITVLKDGKKVGTVVTAKSSQDEIIRMMVGRELDHLFPQRQSHRESPALELKHLTGKAYSDISMTAYSGEILGIYGLIGSGRTELARSIFGIDPLHSGEIRMEGRPAIIAGRPRRAIDKGIVYITEDRKEDGLFLEMSIRENISAACIKELSGAVFVHREQQNSLALDLIDRLRIKAFGTQQEVDGLSGGNQQKVLFAKWLALKPKVVIADEPTRGIDIGAKAEVHDLLRKLANKGAAVIMISSELPEIIGMSDRIAIMREGRLLDVLDYNKATEESVGSIALGTQRPQG
jgi:ABC-type sugar transport system ATPase subunit